MNYYVLIIALFLCPFYTAHASIENGFLREKLILEKKIKHNKTLLLKENDTKTSRQIERNNKQLQKKYALVYKKFAQTQELLSSLEFIDPELYAQVSKVTNAEGTLTHVYVRYVSRVSEEYTSLANNHFKAAAYTSVRQSKDNENVCSSLNGTNTITITIGYGCDEKRALGHEFAHVLYVVPNLSTYTDYWNRSNDFCSGHSISDPSYTFLEYIEHNFEIRYNEYLKNMKNKDSSKLIVASKNDNP
jgi:hypothetical protein